MLKQHRSELPTVEDQNLQTPLDESNVDPHYRQRENCKLESIRLKSSQLERDIDSEQPAQQIPWIELIKFGHPRKKSWR